MIKRQLGWTPCRVPPGIASIIAGACQNPMMKNRSEYNADGVTTRITAWISEGADLFEMNSTETGFFEELAGGGFL
jgi:hypothetical protein